PREDPADQHGEFAVRGGIVDIFPAGEAHPVRLEFIGDTIESLRTYDPSNQRSIAAVDQIAVVPLRDVLNDDRRATVFDYFTRARSSRIIVSVHDEIEAAARKVLEQIEPIYHQATRLAELGLDDDADVAVSHTPEALPAHHIRCQPAVEMRGRVADWVAEIKRLRDNGETVLFVAATPGRAERTVELLKDYDVFA